MVTFDQIRETLCKLVSENAERMRPTELELGAGMPSTKDHTYYSEHCLYTHNINNVGESIAQLYGAVYRRIEPINILSSSKGPNSN